MSKPTSKLLEARNGLGKYLQACEDAGRPETPSDQTMASLKDAFSILSFLCVLADVAQQLGPAIKNLEQTAKESNESLSG